MFYEDGTDVYKVHIFNHDYVSASKFGGNISEMVQLMKLWSLVLEVVLPSEKEHLL